MNSEIAFHCSSELYFTWTVKCEKMVCTATRKGTNLVAETMLKTMANTPSDAETNLVAETMSSGGSEGGSKRRLLLLSPLFLLFLCLSLFFLLLLLLLLLLTVQGCYPLWGGRQQLAVALGWRWRRRLGSWFWRSLSLCFFSVFFRFFPSLLSVFFSSVSVLFSIYRKKWSRCAFNHATAGRPVTRSVV